jgi:predicted HAD superfamily Cof-like phosphohydrolase
VWNEAKTTPVPTFEVWTEADEQALVKLEETVELEGAIALEDADSGRLAHQRQHECMASAADMSTEQLAALEQMIAATKGRVSIG